MTATIHALETRRFFAAGVLDPTFGGEGFIVRDFDARTSENVNDLVVQPDGKVVALVPSGANSVPPAVLVRYNRDGTLDTSFGSGGRVSLDFGDAIALGRLGTVLVGGVIDDPVAGNDFGLRRYTRFGALDTTFGQAGLARTDFGAADADLSDLAVARDGTIVAAGRVTAAGFAVARYTRDGAPDTGFDTDGWLTTAFTNGSASARTVAVQPDGRIVVGGTEQPTGSTTINEGRFSIARYLRTGALDTTFGGGDGLVSTTIDANEAQLRDLALQRDGRIVAVGTFTNVLSGPVFARFNRDGSLDPTFAGDGTSAPVFEGAANENPTLERIALDPRGLIYAAGRVRTNLGGGSRTTEAAVARVRQDGTADETWAPRGIMRGQISEGVNPDDRAASIAVARDGKVVAGGRAGLEGGPFDSVVSRLVFDRVGGTATLNRAGTLTIRGTLGSDALRTNLGPDLPGGARDLIVRINDRPGQTFDLASVRRVVVLAGDGNDRVALWSDTADDNGLAIGLGGRPAFIDGGRGNDLLVSEDGADLINGGLGNDQLFGREGIDRLSGGSGDDLLFGAAGGADLLNGGPGNDTAQRDATDRVIGIENDQIAA